MTRNPSFYFYNYRERSVRRIQYLILRGSYTDFNHSQKLKTEIIHYHAVNTILSTIYVLSLQLSGTDV